MVYIPLGPLCTRVIIVTRSANAALPYVLTAYPALKFSNFLSAMVSHNVK